MLVLISTGKQTIHGFEDATSSEHFDLSLHYEITQPHLFVCNKRTLWCSLFLTKGIAVVVYNIKESMYVTAVLSNKVFQARHLVTVLFMPSFFKDLLCTKGLKQ